MKDSGFIDTNIWGYVHLDTKDPFDRMIIATALDYEAKLMSVDGHFKNYPELQGYLLDTL